MAAQDSNHLGASGKSVEVIIIPTDDPPEEKYPRVKGVSYDKRYKKWMADFSIDYQRSRIPFPGTRDGYEAAVKLRKEFDTMKINMKIKKSLEDAKTEFKKILESKGR